MAEPSRSIRPRTLRTPLRKPSAGSAGVDGVFVVVIWPVSSSTATTSVNVPPVSIPMRTRRALMRETLAVRYPVGKGAADVSGAVILVGGARPLPEPGNLVRIETLVSRATLLFTLCVDPAGVRLPGRLLRRTQGPADRRPR